jgi:chaperonin GroEL
MAQVAHNAGFNGGKVVETVRQKRQWGYGLNAATGEYGDLMEAGVLDSVSVVLNALTNAASVAGLVLTTECVVCEKPGK